METSAPKRRRTSPRTSIPVHAQPEADAATPRDAPPPASSPTRPSFASPTRASLQRHNPDILKRRDSQRAQRQSGPSHDTPPIAETPDTAGRLSHAFTTQLGLHSGPRRGRPTQASEMAEHPSSVLGSQPKRLRSASATPRPVPRPLPPHGPEDEELLDPFARRGLRRSPLGVLPEVVMPEPELPPTPERPDPVVSTPPSGIHNTPSKRPRRSKALAEKLKSSSPLKQPPLRPPEKPQKGASSESASSVRPVTIEVRIPSSAYLRSLKPVDPDADKKKKRDSLLAQIAELEQHLDLASKENERLRQAHLARTEASAPENKDEIIEILARHTLPKSAAEGDTAAPLAENPALAWLSSAMDPAAFLPFGKPMVNAPILFPPAEETEPQAPPISHHPIPMTATEALPYLQVFTPLTFTSHIAPLPPDDAGASGARPLLQRHYITATSTAPRGLFTAHIEMTVNTKTKAIASLAVSRLDPAATAELTPLINQVIPPENDPWRSSGVHNNISVLTWGMGEWLRAATERARAWSTLESEVGVGGGDAKGVEAMCRHVRERAEARRKERRRRKKRKRDDDADDNDGEASTANGRKKYEAGDLFPFMGRTTMDFEIPALFGRKGDQGGREEGSTLRVSWRIEFDWTGEARRRVGVLVGVPGKWHKCDGRGQLSGLPKLFDELVRGGEEPLDAIRTVMCLLAGEHTS